MTPDIPQTAGTPPALLNPALEYANQGHSLAAFLKLSCQPVCIFNVGVCRVIFIHRYSLMHVSQANNNDIIVEGMQFL